MAATAMPAAFNPNAVARAHTTTITVAPTVAGALTVTVESEAGALLASGQLAVEGRAKGTLLHLFPWLLLVDLAASRAGLGWAIPGLLWLYVPFWVGNRARQPLWALFRRDLPAHRHSQAIPLANLWTTPRTDARSAHRLVEQ